MSDPTVKRPTSPFPRPFMGALMTSQEVVMSDTRGLDAKRRKQLKQAAHHLKPVIRIGQKGVTENLINETDSCLERHELIKVHVAAGDKQARTVAAEQLADAVQAQFVHQIGKVFVLYRHREGVRDA